MFKKVRLTKPESVFETTNQEAFEISYQRVLVCFKIGFFVVSQLLKQGQTLRPKERHEVAANRLSEAMNDLKIGK